ncbi:MAG TPA: HD domain-containing phosphohydrolase [Steroidobacteraceae bacterium]|jgi:HD-GYP domain-containing protein (c-di-GMP phosphodiesterase class II)
MASPFRALSPWNDVRRQLAELLHDEREQPHFLDRIGHLTLRIDALIDEDRDAAIFAVMQFDQSDYGVNHSLQAAVICATYGRVSGWSEPERCSAIGAGLTMNIAMLDLQQELYHQREPPSAAQREAIRNHPQCGHDLLERLGLCDRLWLQIVIEHHESADGHGYPSGTGEPLPLAAALGLADRYSAKITRRLYRAALAPDTAIRELYQMNPGEARVDIDRMVEAVGLWPPGTFVELANGETAVVATRGEGSDRQPLVYALLNAQLAEIKPTARDTSEAAYEIKGSAGPISMGATARLPRLVAAAALA